MGCVTRDYHNYTSSRDTFRSLLFIYHPTRAHAQLHHMSLHLQWDTLQNNGFYTTWDTITWSTLDTSTDPAISLAPSRAALCLAEAIPYHRQRKLDIHTWLKSIIGEMQRDIGRDKEVGNVPDR